jgi:aspartate-semialdehyde dehydrogenase
MSTRPLNVALIGATGLVGRAALEALAEAELDLGSLKLLASPRSAGARIEFADEELPVAALSDAALKGVDLALFCVPEEVARAWVPKARAAGATVVDASAAFRDDPGVPLVVPEVNAAALAAVGKGGLVASPGTTATALAVALAPLHAAAGLERVVVSTYQSVASAGHRAVEQLEREAADLMNGREPEPGAVLPHRIAFNLFPHIGAALPDGRTDEEARVAAEARKVLGLAGLGVSATAVRVPLFYGHAAAVNATFARPLAPADARELLRKAPGLKLLDDAAERIYPMPMLAVNDDAVLVGRVRADPSHPSGLDLFVATDDLRKGAAVNLVQVARLVAAKL